MRDKPEFKTLAEMQEHGHKVRIEYFDSMSEFTDDCATRRETGRFIGQASWSGARNVAHATEIVKRGLPQHNERIRKLSDAVQVDLPSTVDGWQASVQGPVPIVPAAIAGLPDCMLQPVKLETSGTPLRIFVSVASSGGCGNEVIEARGIAIIALLEALSAKRATELYLYAEYDDARALGINTPVVRVGSMPLDTTALTAALTCPAVARVLFMHWAQTHDDGGFGGLWAWGGAKPDSPETMSLTREALGATQEDLLLPAAFLDKKNLIVADPVQWVKNQVAETEKLSRGAE